MTSYTQRRHGVFHKKRRVTHTLRKSRRRVMKGGMKKTKRYEDGRVNDEMQPLTLLLQDGDVSELAFHPTEPLLLSLCRGTLVLQRFNRDTGDIINNIPIPRRSPVQTIAFHPLAPIFAVGNIEGEVDLFKWEITEGLGVGLSANMSTTEINRGYRKQCEIIAFHPREPLFATCGETESEFYTTRIWRIEEENAASPVQLVDLQCEIMTNKLSCIAFHPTQPILITASTMKFCKHEDIAAVNNVTLWNYFSIVADATDVADIDDDDGGDDADDADDDDDDDDVPDDADINKPRIVTILSSRPRPRPRPREEEFVDITCAFNSDHSFFHDDFVNFVAFHPTEPFFATASKDTTIKLWRMSPIPLVEGQEPRDQTMYATCMTTFTPEVQYKSPVTCVAFHPEAPLLVGGYSNGHAVVWEYMGILSKKVFNDEPEMYEYRQVSVFPLPPHRLRITPEMLTEAKSKFRKRSPSHPPEKGLTRPAELSKKKGQRKLVASSHVFVSAVNFQVDSRGVSFLEIGRNNTNVVELQNVSHFVSEAKIKKSEQNKQLLLRRTLMDKLSRHDGPPPRQGNSRFTQKDIIDSILGITPNNSKGPGVTFVHSEDWEETLKLREQGDQERKQKEQERQERQEKQSKGGNRRRTRRKNRRNK